MWLKCQENCGFYKQLDVAVSETTRKMWGFSGSKFQPKTEISYPKSRKRNYGKKIDTYDQSINIFKCIY